MLRFANPDIARGLVLDTTGGHRDEETYDRHATNLYRQALFALDDAELAEQVVSDVIVEECVRPAAGICGEDAASRLAISAYRRCKELADNPAPRSGVPVLCTGNVTGCLGGLNAEDRCVLGLILFSALRYRQVAAHLGISASGVSGLLRAVLVTAAGAKRDGLPYVSQERRWPAHDDRDGRQRGSEFGHASAQVGG